MHNSLINDLKPFSPIIIESFEASMTIQQCAEKLKPLGFQFDELTDQTLDSNLFEAIRDVLLQHAWIGNESLRDYELGPAFLGFMFDVHQSKEKLLILLSCAIDSIKNPKGEKKRKTMIFWLLY